jgi:integrase
MLKPVAMPDLRQRTGGTYTARIKIPRDVAADYAKTYGPRWSVKASWRGLTDAEAKVKCTEWGNVIDGRIKALRAARKGQRQTLDHRELHALVGLWYTEYVAKYEAKPGDPEGWQHALDDLGEALTLASGPEDSDLSYDDLLADASTLATIRDDVARATAADAFLADHGYALTRESRAALLDALAPRYVDALGLLLKRAKGDYSRDPIADTFPTLEPKAQAGVSIAALFDQWCNETKPANGTIRRWKPVIDAAQAQWPDIRKVTEGSAREWLRSLVNDKRSAHTVSTIWRTALKTICNWAIGQGLLTNNPFARVKIVVPRKIATRESKAFTDSEANTILAAALAYDEPGALRDAKRWLPWLCAYSGARAGEIAQLRSQDVVQRDGIWTLTLTPEAGTIKNRKPRTVPLHEHIIAQGFLDFVTFRARGPLLYNGPPSEKRVRHIVQKVGEWVRALGINDPEIRPNHAWRHLFKLVAERAGIPERLSDVITGHAPASIGRAYGQPTLVDLAREMEKLPRYEV